MVTVVVGYHQFLQVDIQHMGIMHALQAVVKIIDKF
jgi:hypothetical protein